MLELNVDYVYLMIFGMPSSDHTSSFSSSAVDSFDLPFTIPASGFYMKISLARKE
jgi:hypothetical protein